ncbi:PHD finger protein [Acorus calamus]|uniref:PHD finger protein n=1 Tax=Acorus calamus TaxID=4465 RepID=A0AAV9D5K2_ACOCL|nr:PHD finger protein [Acorus calamus]
MDPPTSKRARTDGDLKRVAEIVMLLSAMGEIRGGRGPTEAETGLAAEAIERLAEFCGSVAPKELFGRDGVRVLVEDLGLNRSRDHNGLGFRPPKMSIVERLALTKKKMQESKEFAAQSASMYSSTLLQTGFGSSVENHNTLFHAADKFLADKPSPMPLSLGGLQSASTGLATATPMMKQPQSSESMSPMSSVKSLSTPMERDPSTLVLPRTEAVHFRLDARGDMTRVNSSGAKPLEKGPTVCSTQSASATGRVGQASRAPDHSSLKVEGGQQVNAFQNVPKVARENVKLSGFQAAPGSLHSVPSPLPGLNFVPVASLYTNHIEIARSVQNFVQPKFSDPPSWTPPPIDYMNKPLDCEVCKLAIDIVDSLLVCDNCEKGVHLKCLQHFNKKGIPTTGDWHCLKCLNSSNGKPLPPKYGRVTRSGTASKVSSTASAGFSAKKMENSDSKSNPQKTVANGNPPGGPSLGIRQTQSSQDIKTSKDLSNEKHMAEEPSKRTSELEEMSGNKEESESNREVKNSSTTKSEETLVHMNISKDCSMPPLEHLHSVEWVGDTLQVVDDKSYYQSCRIRGVVYNLQDYVLLHLGNQKMTPSKLKVLFEENKSGLKWAIVNRCYFPSDLPEAVSRPCSPENDEVYESNNESNVMTGLIQGPCVVLPFTNFKEESERRSHLEREIDDSLRPLFLCRLSYDESKGLLQPVVD